MTWVGGIEWNDWMKGGIDNGQKEETESSKIKILIDFLLLNCFILTQITLNHFLKQDFFL